MTNWLPSWLGAYRPEDRSAGRVGDTEHYRNVRRHDVQTDSQLLAVRVDESLYFANTA